MLPILAAVLAFITIGGLGWVFVGGDDSTAQAVKRAQNLGEAKKSPAIARKAAAASPPPAKARPRVRSAAKPARATTRKSRVDTAAYSAASRASASSRSSP